MTTSCAPSKIKRGIPQKQWNIHIAVGLFISFPYGNGIKSWSAYFTNYHLIPLKRCSEIFEDIFGHRICEELSEQVYILNEAVKQQLIDSKLTIPKKMVWKKNPFYEEHRVAS